MCFNRNEAYGKRWKSERFVNRAASVISERFDKERRSH